MEVTFRIETLCVDQFLLVNYYDIFQIFFFLEFLIILKRHRQQKFKTQNVKSKIKIKSKN